jgi:Ca2+-binding EF-hand superfamily protein
VFKINIEDIIKPLATKIKVFGVNVSQLFDKYDTNGNGRLSVEELARAFKNDFNFSLQDDEIVTIKEYFRAKHKSAEIGKLDFIDLLQSKFVRKFDPEDAKKSL